MDNYKILVTKAENIEIQKAFFELGYTWNGNDVVQPVSFPVNGKYWISTRKVGMFNSLCWSTGHAEGKLITLPQLRDLVVLKRNDVNDANWETEGGDQIFKDSNDKSYIYRSDGWDELQRHEMRQAMWEKPKAKEKDQGLISGAEAKLAWANGERVECISLNEWHGITNEMPLSVFDRIDLKFRLKPTTLTINAELPKPSNTTLHNQNYSVTYEFSSREDRNAFVEGLGGNNS
jgi:hypothetical protein